MGREPTAVECAEYACLRGFVQTAFDSGVLGDVPDLPADAHPTVVYERLWARSPTSALKGLREAASDIVEATQDLDAISLGALEARLAGAGAPSLAAVRDQRVRQIFEVMRNGKVSTEDEARLLQSVLTDSADRVLDARATDLANATLESYERGPHRRRP